MALLKRLMQQYAYIALYIAAGATILAAILSIVAALGFDQISDEGIKDAKAAAAEASRASREARESAELAREENAKLEETLEELKKALHVADFKGTTGLGLLVGIRAELKELRESPLATQREIRRASTVARVQSLSFLTEAERSLPGSVTVESLPGDEPRIFAEEIANSIRTNSKAQVTTLQLDTLHGVGLVGLQVYANPDDIAERSTSPLMDKWANILKPFNYGEEMIKARPDVTRGSFVVLVGRNVALEAGTREDVFVGRRRQ